MRKIMKIGHKMEKMKGQKFNKNRSIFAGLIKNGRATNVVS
jgi:hypothetical protein